MYTKLLSTFYDLHAKQADETLHAPQPAVFTYSNPATSILVGSNLSEMNKVKMWTILDKGIPSSCSEIVILKELSSWSSSNANTTLTHL